MSMLTDHPAIKDGLPVEKSAVRYRMIPIMLDADDLRGRDMSGSLLLYIDERLYRKDTSLTVDDDDVNVIIDLAGNRWRFTAGEHYEIAVSSTLGIGPSELLLVHRFATNVSFAENFAGSRGVALATATLQKVFAVKKNGLAFGTATFEPGLPDPVFVTAGGIYLAGDYMTVTGPAASDATLASIGLTFVGTR